MKRPSAPKVAEFFVKLSRPQNVIYPGLLSAIMATTTGASLRTVLACYLFFLCFYAIAAGYNNLHDQYTDSLNARTDNPLVLAQPPAGTLWIYFTTNAAVALFAQCFLEQPLSIVISVMYILLLIGYSHPVIKFQSRGLWKIFILCVCYGVLPCALGLFQGEMPGRYMAALAVFQVPLLFPILLAKDYKDELGDRATGKRTPVVLYGRRIVGGIALTAGLLSAALFGLIGYYARLNTFLIAAFILSYWLLTYWLHCRRSSANLYAGRLASMLLIGMSTLLTTHLIHR